jgi:DNA-binding transcriptional ArsR family regulator
MTDERLGLILKALSSPSRLRIVRLLCERSFCVNALTARLSISQPAVSQHLAVLKDAGLVVDERCGKKVHYRLDASRLEEVRSAVTSIVAVKAADRTAVAHTEGGVHASD